MCVDVFFRRRSRQARNVANKVGLWSIAWCQRLVNWSRHLDRSASYAHPCSSLIKMHDSTWLMHARSQWIGEFSIRNSMFAGRTGTRLNIGRPQIRWQDGLKVAHSVLDSRDLSIKGSNSLSIAKRIRESLIDIRNSLSVA